MSSSPFRIEIRKNPNLCAKSGDEGCGRWIDKGHLCLGRPYEQDGRPQYSWIHWKCAGPRTHAELRALSLEKMTGWNTLAQEFRDKVTKDINRSAPRPAAVPAPPALTYAERYGPRPATKHNSDGQAMPSTSTAHAAAAARADGSQASSSKRKEASDRDAPVGRSSNVKIRKILAAKSPPPAPPAPSTSTYASKMVAASSSRQTAAPANKKSSSHRDTKGDSRLDGLVKKNERSWQGAFCAAVSAMQGDVLDLPWCDESDLDRVSRPLFPHQKQAVWWMKSRESPALPTATTSVQLWTLKTDTAVAHFHHPYLGRRELSKPPRFPRGGIIADDMGLGKTAQIIALIASKNQFVMTPDERKRFTDKTLIVCDLGLLSMWKDEFGGFVKLGEMNVVVYHGPKRVNNFASADVIITTYDVLQSVHGVASGKKRVTRRDEADEVFRKLAFRRVIFDEAHKMRNGGKVFLAATSVVACSRWTVTGTPIVNDPQDYYFQLAVTATCAPFNDDAYFKRLVVNPIKKESPEGMETLRALFLASALRRTKNMLRADGTPLISLPPITRTVDVVDLWEDARELYDNVEAKAAKDDAKAAAVQALLRLRQICLHPDLVVRPSAGASSTGHGYRSSVKTEAAIKHVKAHIADGSKALVFCSSASFLSMVGNALDSHGIAYVRYDGSMTISARNEVVRLFQHGQLPASQPTSRRDDSSDEEAAGNTSDSSDDGAATESPPTACTWNMSRDIANGTVTACVMLMTLQAGGVGLTLTAANLAIMLDPWWQAGLEEQAIHRVHRIGQTKPVQVVRILARDTIEDKVVAIQKGKLKVANAASAPSVWKDGKMPTEAEYKADVLGFVEDDSEEEE